MEGEEGRELGRPGNVQLPDFQEQELGGRRCGHDSSAFQGLSRERFVAAAVAEGIPIAPGYIPLYRQGAMREFQHWPTIRPILDERGIDYAHLQLPVAERIANEKGMWIHQSALMGDERDIESIFLAFLKIQKRSPTLIPWVSLIPSFHHGDCFPTVQCYPDCDEYGV